MIILKLKKLCGRGHRRHAKGKQVFTIIPYPRIHNYMWVMMMIVTVSCLLIIKLMLDTCTLQLTVPCKL